MKFIKFLLIVMGLILLYVLGSWAVGVVFTLLWYAFWIGLVGAIGYGGYKLLSKKDEPRKLEEKSPIGIAEVKDYDRALEEYKRKYLPK